MTFDSTEKSVASGAPVELFKFTGTVNTYRFTSREENKTNSDGTYTAIPIRRTAVTSADHGDDALIEVEMPYNNAMVSEYAFNTAPPDLRLQLYRAHINDLDATLLVWEGPVVSWNVSGLVAKLRIPSDFASILAGACPSIRYQAPCNHVLFDDRCQVSAASYQSTRTVLSVTGNVVVLDSSPFSDDACNAGEMEFTSGGERRMIVDNVGTSFTVASAFANLAASDTVVIRQGCNHSFTQCVSKFSNGINFGGFPRVPNRNPFSSRL